MSLFNLELNGTKSIWLHSVRAGICDDDKRVAARSCAYPTEAELFLVGYLGSFR